MNKTRHLESFTQSSSHRRKSHVLWLQNETKNFFFSPLVASCLSPSEGPFHKPLKFLFAAAQGSETGPAWSSQTEDSSTLPCSLAAHVPCPEHSPQPQNPPRACAQENAPCSPTLSPVTTVALEAYLASVPRAAAPEVTSCCWNP